MTEQQTIQAIADGCAGLARRIPSRDELRRLVDEWERWTPIEVVRVQVGELPPRKCGGAGGAWA